MAKFYVESGPLALIVQADDHRMAALWSIHRRLQQWIEDRLAHLPEDRFDQAVSFGQSELADTIRVNEIGFGRSDGCRLRTRSVLIEWKQLMVAVARMEASLSDGI